MTVTGSETTSSRIKLSKLLTCCLLADIGPQKVPGILVSHVSQRFISRLCFLSFKQRKVAFCSCNGITSVSSFMLMQRAPLHLNSPGFHPLCFQAAPTDCSSRILTVTTKAHISLYEHPTLPRKQVCMDWEDGMMRKMYHSGFFGQPFQLHLKKFSH